MTSLQLSRIIAKAAEDKKARGVVRLDIRQRTSIADYFVICEGDTDRQVRAIIDSITQACREVHLRPLHTAGYEEGSWVVLDYATVIVHVFLPGERAYYDLESLWRAPVRPLASTRRRRTANMPASNPLKKEGALMPDKGKSKSGGAKKPKGGGKKKK